MLSVILTILKIIGIVLLVLLGIVILLLLLVLFVPIFYRAEGHVPRTGGNDSFDAEKIRFKASFSWMLFVIRGGIDYPDSKEFTLRLFGIKILPKKNKEADDKKEKPESEDASKESEDKVTDKEEGFSDKEGDASDKEMTSQKEEDEPAAENGILEEEKSSDSGEDNTSASTASDSGEDDSKSLLDILWDIIEKTESFLKTPQNVFEKIQYTIYRVCGKITMIKSTLENDIFKRAFELVKKRLIKIIKMILPDKCDIKVLFGSGDPADTAQIFGTYAALYPVLYDKIRLEPSFDEKVVMADGSVKGHITLFTILYGVLVCYFNRDVKKVIKRFKKILDS